MNIYTERLGLFRPLAVDEQRDAAERFLPSIQQFAARDLEAEDVLVRGCLLCNDKRDHYYSRFTKTALEEVAEMLPGRPVADSHNYRLRAEGRFFDAKVVTRGEGKRKVNWVEALFYLPNTARGQEVAQRIDTGIDREMSIGWNCIDQTCNVCGDSIMRCGHIPGDIYEGTGFCEYEFDGITNAFEGSLVLAGGQKDTTTFVPDGTRSGLATSALLWSALPALKRESKSERGLLDALFGPEPVPGIRHLVHAIEVGTERGDRQHAAGWVREHGFRANRYEQADGQHQFSQFAPGDVEGRKLVKVRLDDGVVALALKSKERRDAANEVDAIFQM
jgi:hypothetical protein